MLKHALADKPASSLPEQQYSLREMDREKHKEPAQGSAVAEYTLLIAEDNKVNQIVVEKMLQKLGYRSICVRNGREAIEMLDKQSVDLILMDCQMPEMDGFEATAAIREREATDERHTPIIALTAHAMKGDRERCIEAGMDDHVAKPVQEDALKAAIERWLNDAVPKQVHAVVTEPEEATKDKANPALAALANGQSPDVADPAIQLVEAAQDASHAPLVNPAAFSAMQSLLGDGVDALIDKFHETAEQNLKRMDAALQKDARTEISMAAHTLKSCCFQVGAEQIGILLQQLEDHAEQMDPAILRNLVNQVHEAYEVSRSELDALYQDQRAAM